MAALQGEFLARRQLPFASIAGETGEMIDVVASSPHPVTRLDMSTAFGTFVSKMSEEKEEEEEEK